jgi:signal transduction histidine kinase
MLWASGTAAAWAATTVSLWRLPHVEAFYSPIAAMAALFVSPAYGGAVCVASLLALCAMPPPERGIVVLPALAVVAVSGCAIHAAYRQRAERRDFERMVSVVREVSASLDSSEVLSAIVRTAREATGAKASSLRLLDRDGRTLVVRAAEGLSRAYMDKGPVDVRRSPIDRKVLAGESVQIRDVADTPLVQYPQQAQEEGIAAMLCVPLRRNGRVIGVLRVYSGRPRPFTARDERMLVGLAAQAVTALRHAELHQQTLSFIRKVTHELRAPLGAIGTNLKVLLEGIPGALTDKQLEMLQRADRRTMLLMEAVNDLLSLSRARLPKPSEDRLEVRLQDTVESVVALMQTQSQERGVKLALSVAPAVSPLRGNPDELEELVSNLLSNAIKYTPTGGAVTVAVGGGEGTVSLRVADTGIGIPADELPRLFDEFHRCANARRAGIEGTGLGMAIVKAIADRHHADLRVDSGPDQGTVVEVVFPTTRAA